MAPEGLWLYMSCMPLEGSCPCVIKGSLLPGTAGFYITDTIKRSHEPKRPNVPSGHFCHSVAGVHLILHTTELTVRTRERKVWCPDGPSGGRILSWTPRPSTPRARLVSPSPRGGRTLSVTDVVPTTVLTARHEGFHRCNSSSSLAG